MFIFSTKWGCSETKFRYVPIVNFAWENMPQKHMTNICRCFYIDSKNNLIIRHQVKLMRICFYLVTCITFLLPVTPITIEKTEFNMTCCHQV